jgi:hypothetical protein
MHCWGAFIEFAPFGTCFGLTIQTFTKTLAWGMNKSDGSFGGDER